MNSEQREATQRELGIRRLLIENFGRPLLLWALGATDEQLDSWLTASDGCPLRPAQEHALAELWGVLQSVRSGDPRIRQMNLHHLLGHYIEEHQATVVNAIRSIATGYEYKDRSAPTVVDGILDRLAEELYGLYLLPAADNHFSVMGALKHPLHSSFEKAVMEDEVLARLFPEEKEGSGRVGSVIRSTGRGGGIQLRVFGGQLITAAWGAAEVDTNGEPTLPQLVEAVEGQLETVRRAVVGEKITVPVRIGFTGILLPPGTVLDFGWGTLRSMEDRDKRVVPTGLEGKRQGSMPDGSSVVVDYAGDVVLETLLDFKIQLKEVDVSDEWPRKLRAYEQIGRTIEDIRLAALLSGEDDERPTTVLSTWQYIQDPFDFGRSMSWNDPRMSRSFMPRQLTEEDGQRWKTWIGRVRDTRNDNIEIAIRRALRAATERRDHADVVVDCVIAWESLFGSRNGEPTLRVTGSLAWLIENSAEKRIELRKELSDLYALRSDIVHGNKRKAKRDIAASANRAFRITLTALRLLFTDRNDLIRDHKDGDARSNMLLMGG